jgi:hypothetical protein
MYERTEHLIRELLERFSYTEDNNRDLVTDPSFPLADTLEELTVQWAYNFLIAHLNRCDPATDRACWGD